MFFSARVEVQTNKTAKLLTEDTQKEQKEISSGNNYL